MRPRNDKPQEELFPLKSRVILATTVTRPGIATECDAALEMLDTLEAKFLTAFQNIGYCLSIFTLLHRS